MTTLVRERSEMTPEGRAFGVRHGLALITIGLIGAGVAYLVAQL